MGGLNGISSGHDQMMGFCKHGDKYSASTNEDNFITVWISNFRTSLHVKLVCDLLMLLKKLIW